LEADLDYARKAMDVNLFTRVAVTQAFAPLLIRSKGTIVNIGSIAGVYPSVWQGIYGASCAAANHWSDILQNEMAPFGVKVVLVSLLCQS
jgi:1-acylglycerone phosphate reductase